MTILINMTSRDPDVFRWNDPNHHGKPVELLRMEHRIDRLSAKYIRMCDVVPLPVTELEELDDLIKHMEKVHGRLWDEWQAELIYQ